MCTVIVEVPQARTESVRLLAVRDEDPARPWDPPGAWWSDRPGVVGVRDRRAGGAWLAAAPETGRLAVILNRADISSHGIPAPSNGFESRGSLVLDAVAGFALPESPRTAGFNLVSISAGRVLVSSWDGETLRHEDLAPGMHMIAHHDVDDRRSARIESWLPAFGQLTGGGPEWRTSWLALLERTAELSPHDDRAIIRDNRSHGYETQSLLVCTAEVIGAVATTETDSSVEPPAERSLRLESATLARPGVWGAPKFQLG